MGAAVDVTFQSFVNRGKGITGKSLGPQNLMLGFMLNAIEVQFSLAPDISSRFKDLVVRQWSGPESVWTKKDTPAAPWTKVSSGPGTGEDDPDENNVVRSGDTMAFFDSPGPNVSKFNGQKIVWAFVSQNFTAWVEGKPVKGGAHERLHPVVGWHSVASIINFDATNPQSLA